MPSTRSLQLLVALAIAVPVAAGAGMRLVAQAEVGHLTNVVALDPVARKAFVASWRATTIVDLDTLVVHTTPATRSSVDAALVDTASGRLYLATGNGGSSRFLTMLDTRSLTTLAEFPLPFNWGPMAADFARGEIYLATDARIAKVDARSGATLATVNVGYGVAALAVDRTRGRILAGRSEWGDAQVAIVDVATWSIVATPFVHDGGPPCHEEFCFGDDDFFFETPGGQRVIVDERTGDFYLLHGTGRISVVGGDPYVVRAQAHNCCGAANVGSAQTSAAWRRVYVNAKGPDRYYAERIPDDVSDLVFALDAASGASTRLPIPGAVIDEDSHVLLMDDDGGDLYVTSGSAPASLNRLEPATLAVRETLPLTMNHVEAMVRDPVTGRIVVVGQQRIAIVESSGAKPGTRVATAFRHAGFDHHFVAADPIEHRLVDDGRFGPDWRVSPDLFRVWSQPVAGSVPVCRFFSARFAPKSSHFYTPLAAECDTLEAAGDWQYEGVVFHVALPDAAGACPPGTEPLYRLYNQGASGAPNHRYTAFRSTRDEAVARGWVAEGVGPDTVFACTPALR
jgi:DNA-binding beta-propeller fold protein YncE